jgi:hypothetical protein
LLLEISNKLQKLGLDGKNQLNPQCVHIAEFRNFQFKKCEKMKNVFTLGATARATLG